MSQELEILQMVTTRLAEANIPYMVTGSIAMNYYAVPRMTRDIDIDETAQALVIASLKEKTPHLTREALRRALFLRFYGGDFDKNTSEKILATLAKVV